MQQISWEADSHSASHEIPRLLRNPKLHYHVHKSPSLTPFLMHQSTPSHLLSLRTILILSTHLCLGFPNGLFPSGFPTNILYACLPCILLLFLSSLIILCAVYKLWLLSGYTMTFAKIVYTVLLWHMPVQSFILLKIIETMSVEFCYWS